MKRHNVISAKKILKEAPLRLMALCLHCTVLSMVEFRMFL